MLLRRALTYARKQLWLAGDTRRTVAAASSGAASPPPPSTPLPLHSTGGSVDESEVAKFDDQAAAWWDPDGVAAPLHRLNPVRVAYVRAALERRAADAGSPPARRGAPPLAGMSVLDVGCGGGLVTEPLARLGADVLGVDMSEVGIAVARAHAAADLGLVREGRLKYEQRAVEELVADGVTFNAVLALEVIEHVAEPNHFLRDCAALVKPGGLLVLSTLNRTAASYALGIVAAERVLRWLPEGTHDWSRFPTPYEVLASLETEGGLVCEEVAGLTYNPLRNAFSLSEDTSVNYIMTAVKPLGRGSSDVEAAVEPK